MSTISILYKHSLNEFPSIPVHHKWYYHDYIIIVRLSVGIVPNASNHEQN